CSNATAFPWPLPSRPCPSRHRSCRSRPNSLFAGITRRKQSTYKLRKMSKRIDFIKGLKELNESDLQARIQEDELRLKKLEFTHAISPLENPMSIRSLRKDLARLKTELKARKNEVSNLSK